MIELPYRITNGCCEYYKDKLIFLYGYDVMGKSMDGQAMIKGHENTFPITTMYKFCNSGARYFTDADHACFEHIDSCFAAIPNDGRLIIPLRKMGEGCSRLKELAPRVHIYLYERLKAIGYPEIIWQYDWQ